MIKITLEEYLNNHRGKTAYYQSLVGHEKIVGMVKGNDKTITLITRALSKRKRYKVRLNEKIFIKNSNKEEIE